MNQTELNEERDLRLARVGLTIALSLIVILAAVELLYFGEIFWKIL